MGWRLHKIIERMAFLFIAIVAVVSGYFALKKPEDALDKQTLQAMQEIDEIWRVVLDAGEAGKDSD